MAVFGLAWRGKAGEMPVPLAVRSLVADGVWASSPAAQRQTPEQLGLDRAVGFPPAYEQQGTGKYPERTGFNQMLHEITAAIIDLTGDGILAWSADLDYPVTPTTDPFVTTSTGLWRATVSTGPSFGNVTDPDQTGQTVWHRY